MIYVVCPDCIPYAIIGVYANGPPHTRELQRDRSDLPPLKNFNH